MSSSSHSPHSPSRQLSTCRRQWTPSSTALVAWPWFRFDDTVVRTIAMAAQFDAAHDVTWDDLRVELIYPQDATAERFFPEQARQ